VAADDVLEVQTGRGAGRIWIESVEIRGVLLVEQGVYAAQYPQGLGVVAQDHLQVALDDRRGLDRPGVSGYEQPRWEKSRRHCGRHAAKEPPSCRCR
jgi:hypothetical protein